MAHTPIAFALSAAAALLASSAAAQGRLGQLEHGTYVCALPGNAAGAAWIEAPENEFTITGASTYKTRAGSGSYLLEGRALQFTRGPLKGRHLLLIRSGLLQESDKDGRLGRLRCHRARA